MDKLKEKKSTNTWQIVTLPWKKEKELKNGITVYISKLSLLVGGHIRLDSRAHRKNPIIKRENFEVRWGEEEVLLELEGAMGMLPNTVG